ncbi:hypothetical protein TSMEX_008878 [Taenia solium]|eukprot:TsM_000521100 transcript=TsM_000521100 gene=TsM_000521100
MNLSTWVYLSLFISVVFTRSEIALSSDSGDLPVLIGQSVTLRCTVSSRFAHQTNLSIIFLQNGTMKAENCKAYNTERYEVTCEAGGNTINTSTQTYLFHIKSISWTDRGKWTCLLSGSSSDIFLEVHASPLNETRLHVATVRRSHSQQPVILHKRLPTKIQVRESSHSYV